MASDTQGPTLEQRRAVAIAKAKARAAAAAADKPWRADPVVGQPNARQPWLNDPVVAPASRPTAAPSDASPPAARWDTTEHQLRDDTDEGLRSLGIGFQGAGRGLADLAGFPVDTATGVMNALASAVERLTGARLGTIRKPFGGSDSIADLSSRGVKAVGGPAAVSESDMTLDEKLGYNVNRFGSQAVAGSAALASRAPELAQRLVTSSPVRKVGDFLVRQYLDSPARTFVGDAAAGAGAGVGATMADKYAPDNPLAKFLGVLAGGAAGATVPTAATVTKDLATSALAKAIPDMTIPRNPRTGVPYTSGETEAAAREMQDAALSPATAASKLREGANELRFFVTAGEMPTSGLLSRDPGLVTMEQGARIRDGVPFVARDQSVKEAASENVASLRDPGADQAAVAARAGAEKASRMTPANLDITLSQEAVDAADAARRAEGAQMAIGAGSERRANASRDLDKAVVTDTYLPERARKNELFNAVDPEGTAMRDTTPLAEAVTRIRQAEAGLPPSLRTDSPILRDIEQLVDPETGQATPMAFRDLETMRMKLSRAAQEARGRDKPNYDLADAYDALRAEIGREAGRMAAEGGPAGERAALAEQNYRTDFAPKYRAGPGDEMTVFTRAIDRDQTRSTTAPTETAGRFLRTPEKAAALERVLTSSPSQAEGRAAVRDYLVSDYASSVLNPDGTVNANRALAWKRNNEAVLAQLPVEIRAHFDRLVLGARNGEARTEAAKAQLKAALDRSKATEAEIDRSSIGTLLREDPRDVAESLLSGKWNAERRIDEIDKVIGPDERARRGWKAAFSDVLYHRVTSTRTAGENYEALHARLAAEFKANTSILAKVYSPEEMHTLQQVHKLLGYFKEAEKRAAVAPAGNGDLMGTVIGRSVQLAVRHIYGDLKGGGIIRRFRLFASLLPTNREAVREITQMAWFNPDIAAYLLEKPVRNFDAAPYNINLKRLIALAAAGRDSADDSAQGGPAN